jgi:hypothetical protein
MSEGTSRTIAGKHIVSTSSGRGTHIEKSVPIDDLWGISNCSRLVGTADIGFRPFHQVFCAPTIDIAVSCTNIKIVVAPVLHHVGVAQTAVLQARKNHWIGPSLSTD